MRRERERAGNNMKLQRLLGGLAGGGSLVVAATLADKIPVAIHESGHTIVGRHFHENGIRCRIDDSHCHFGTITTAAGQPLVRYATITPRVTQKQQTYLGETKLTLKWRDMHRHLRWQQQLAEAAGSSGSKANANASDDASPPVLACGSLATTPAAMQGLARMAYLMGGRAAQDQFAQRCLGSAWYWPSEAAEFVIGGLEARYNFLVGREEDQSTDIQAAAPFGELSRHTTVSVESMLQSPGTARGDVRKAKEIAISALSLDASVSPEEGSELALRPAFAFADAILRHRWDEVCLLSGALFVRGTVDGSQLDALVQQRRMVATRRDGGVAAVLAEAFPFLFGCYLASSATAWPPPNLSLPSPGEKGVRARAAESAAESASQGQHQQPQD